MRPRFYDLARLFRAKRIEANLTQSDVGRLLGYRSQFIANWERGVCNPPPEAVAKMMHFFKVHEEVVLELIGIEVRKYWEKVLRTQKGRKSNVER